jgi:hypothetical protein
MADEAEVVVTINLSVMVPDNGDLDIIKVSEVITRAQLGLALEGYTATVMMMTHTREAE